MNYDPRPDLLYLKERLDEQDKKIDKLEESVRKLLKALYIVIGGSPNESILFMS